MLVGSYIIAAGLSIVSLLVSDKFSYAHTSAKFLGTVASLVLISFFVLEKKLSFSLPTSKKIKACLVILLVSTITPLFMQNPGEPVTGLSLILLWALLAFSISSIVKAEGAKEFLTRLIKIQVPVLMFMFIYLLVNELLSKSDMKPFFGNRNIVSNFLAVTTLQLFFLFKVERAQIWKFAAASLSTLSLILLFLLESRGAFLGLLFGSCVLLLNSIDFRRFFTKLPSSKKTLLLIVFLFTLGGLGAFFTKKGLLSLSYRYSFWVNTLCLVKDHPLGVGPGSFEYVFQHYNGRCYPSAEAAEGTLIRNPHNMFIEYFGEIGIVGGFALLFLLFFLILELRKNAAKNPEATTWVLGHGALIAALGFFEFPQDTPYTLFFIAILTGVALSLIPSQKNPQSSYLRIINLAASILVAFIFVIKAYSDHLTLHPGPNKHLSYLSACSLNKENWRGCVFLGLSYLERNEDEKAAALINELSTRFEGHHSLLHLKGTYALKHGDMKTACKEFKKYHLMFDQKTSKKEFLEKNCKF